MKREDFACCKEVSVALSLNPENRRKIKLYYTKFKQKYCESKKKII